MWKISFLTLAATSIYCFSSVYSHSESAATNDNPIAYNEESVSEGRLLYIWSCSTCHGPDGKARIDVVGNATDLTRPEFFENGSSDAEIFATIRHGAGAAMPPFNSELTEDETWHLVNFIKSLQEH